MPRVEAAPRPRDEAGTRPGHRARLRVAPLGLLCLSLLLLPPQPAVAQLPPAPEAGDAPHALVVSVNVLTPPLEIPMLGQGVYEVTVDDLSVDRAPDGQGFLHTIFLELRNHTVNNTGWTVSLRDKMFQSQAGASFRTAITVSAAPTVKGQYFRFNLQATLTSTGPGTPVQDDQEIFVKLRPFSLANMDVRGEVPHVGPFEDLTIPIVLENAGQYPDSFLLTAQGPEGWFVSIQPRTTLQPGEQRTILIHATSPATRVFQPQETAVILVQAVSERDPGVVYERAAIVVLEGMHLPEYWAPLILAGVVAAGLTGRKAVEDARRRAKEQGQPGPVRLTPAQRVLLADLKVRDPERYNAVKQRQKLAMQARQRAFNAIRGRRAALERALIDRQHRQVREAKAAERQAQREDELRERELERQKALLLREKERREQELARKQARAEALRQREEERRARLAAPSQRKVEAERKARERKLRAELARKQRLLAVEERKRRVELEQRRRVLERKRKEAERNAKRRAKAQGRARPAKPPREGGLFGRKKPPAGEGGGEDQA